MEWDEEWERWLEDWEINPEEHLDEFGTWLDLREAALDGEDLAGEDWLDSLQDFIQFCIENDIDVDDALEALYEGT